jgi:hypothetical protein
MEQLGRKEGSARVQSKVHDPCYHELHDQSTTFMVLVFSKFVCFVRKILQREENKGVEFTGGRGNILRELDGNPGKGSMRDAGTE